MNGPEVAIDLNRHGRSVNGLYLQHLDRVKLKT